MSLLLSRLSRPALVRRSSLLHHLLLSKGFSSSLLQTPPCFIVTASPCGENLGKLVVMYANGRGCTDLEKKVPLELVDSDLRVTIGASYGWVAALNKDDGILRLQDDLNPFASDTDPKRISLPPLVTLPCCQTQMDCVVAVKFLGPQLSFCRPAQSNKPEWTNVRIENPCFYSSPVMFSNKDDMFRIPGSRGHFIRSWDHRTENHKPKFQRLRFQNLPELTKTKRELLLSCCTSEHLVDESPGETFLVKWYRRATPSGVVRMKTKALMVYKQDDEGNTLYTQDIGDLCIFISKSGPFCVSASSFHGMCSNSVEVLDVDKWACVDLPDYFIISQNPSSRHPYYIPPQNID
ncbi:hypothetical protein EUTSA_v10015966mg [Eutrema salsugineum]|uniref:KIB1-4 beta-propeller domain-containing protein n=1 Tax=Eutrema salsugineum TaxID=72664 RepID=V4LH29_EUTSA|nr:hypothetical protein EUTSA_v10015966mg [Eutrema salsugineum]